MFDYISGTLVSKLPTAAVIDVGARTIEINRAEYVIRGVGFLESVEDLEKGYKELEAKLGAPPPAEPEPAPQPDPEPLPELPPAPAEEPEPPLPPPLLLDSATVAEPTNITAIAGICHSCCIFIAGTWHCHRCCRRCCCHC